LASGIAYTSSTPGVYNCWKANISSILGFWDSAGNSAYYQPCCGSTQVYTAAGGWQLGGGWVAAGWRVAGSWRGL
jgi:hypothetical protein